MPFKLDKRILIHAAVSVAVLCILFIALGRTDMLWGVLFGFLISLLYFFFLSRDIEKVRDLPREAVKNTLMWRYLLRYAVVGIALLIAFKVEALNILGFVIGFFLLHLNIIVVSLLRSRTNRDL